MPQTPPFRNRGSMVPLRGLQLLCCAVVAGIGIHFSLGTPTPRDNTSIAVTAFELAYRAESGVDAALDAATAGLSKVSVKVQRNDTMDQIFRRMQLSLTDLANIRALDGARSALDRLRPGDELTFARRGDELVGIERPLSLSQTLKVQRGEDNGFTASVEEVPLTRHVIATGGAIDSSLFAAGTAAGLRDITTMALAEVFRWDVDFVLDLRQGDSFRLVYEQLEREGRIVADGEILAAEFINEGRRFRAVRYVNAEGKADFYTPEGTSLRKAFLKAPVQFSRISSVFNPSRRHPVLNRIRAHRGVDYAAPTGTPVKAAGAGRIQFRGVKGGFGNVVEVEHSGRVVTRYGHLSRFAKGVGQGSKVEQGQVIGYVGSTGLATGPHLHFEYIERGVYVDPQKAIRRAQPGPPVPAAERDRFALQSAPLLAKLDLPATGAATAVAALSPVSR
ncbi:MAG: M23 family metallopeptidase [Proteobacteria bacterium]|nr:M23 family metallopeptidase [Pseudomonadota bacterium]